MRKTIFIFCCLVGATGMLLAQQESTRPKKVLTPEQQAYQQQWKEVFGELKELRAEAKQAFDAEMAREKAGDCRDVEGNQPYIICLGQEAGTTDDNYKTYTKAVRAALDLNWPSQPGQESSVGGPAGPALTQAEEVDEFDKMETAWKSYWDIACQAARDHFDGGTGAPAADLECHQRMARERMRDLDDIYYGMLHR
jgi:uncharacterized protein YecT (DUF1311 family)